MLLRPSAPPSPHQRGVNHEALPHHGVEDRLQYLLTCRVCVRFNRAKGGRRKLVMAFFRECVTVSVWQLIHKTKAGYKKPANIYELHVHLPTTTRAVHTSPLAYRYTFLTFCSCRSVSLIWV